MGTDPGHPRVHSCSALVAGKRKAGTTMEGEAVVVVEKKAVMCHSWDAFPDLGEAGPWAAGVGYYYITFLI